MRRLICLGIPDLSVWCPTKRKSSKSCSISLMNALEAMQNQPRRNGVCS